MPALFVHDQIVVDNLKITMNPRKVKIAVLGHTIDITTAISPDQCAACCKDPETVVPLFKHIFDDKAIPRQENDMSGCFKLPLTEDITGESIGRRILFP